MAKIENLGNINDLLPTEGVDKLTTQENVKKKIILRAPVMTSSGYGVHSRQIARWLFEQLDSREDLELFVEPLNWGTTPWIVNMDAYDGLIGRLVQHATQSDGYDISIQLQLPNEWNPFLADYNIGFTAAVETDRCSPDWVNNVNQMDLVVVPSEFVKSVFKNSGECQTKIVVIPEAFTDSCLDSVWESPSNNLEETEVSMTLSKLDTDFNFLIFGQFCGNNPENDRKNLVYTIRWFAEEFKDNPEVGVIIKTNFGRNSKIDRMSTIQTLSQILIETKKGQGPKFYLLHGDMTDIEIASIYRHKKVKALVSFTRGEGFGLPLLEAAACGLPVLATNWSAHIEFLNLGKFMKIDYKLEKIHETRVDNKIFFPEMQWAKADERDAKRKINKFYQSPDVPTAWATDLAKKLQTKYCFAEISKQYTNVFEDII